MKILLIGEYSRLHLTLAEELRALGHQVVLASDGDGHKQYTRDIDLTRKSSGLKDTAVALYNTHQAFNKFRDFDIVQIINPCFLTLSIATNKYFFNQLKKRNNKIVLGAFGDDSFWVKACLENQIFKYSEFFVDGQSTHLKYNLQLIEKWIDSPRMKLNEYIAENADGIVACLYEYYKAYEPYHKNKLKYIPLPIDTKNIIYREIDIPNKLKYFIGIDKIRSEYKGTNLMLESLAEFVGKYPKETEAIIVESVSYEEYQQRLMPAHILLDQLYSHSPSMNPLQAMAQGKIAISGGEPEIYDLLGKEKVTNRPIVNVYPTKKGVREALEYTLTNKKNLPDISHQSRLFVEQYHNAANIAQQYIDFWTNL